MSATAQKWDTGEGNGRRVMSSALCYTFSPSPLS
jgi:hypothetical protein